MLYNKIINSIHNKCMIKKMIALLMIIYISGCSQKSCIEAEDFGDFFEISIESRFDRMSSELEALNGDTRRDQNYNQTLKWQDLGVRTDGNPIKLYLSGSWTSWGNGTGDKNRICGNYKKVVDGNRTSYEIAYKESANMINDVMRNGSWAYGAPCWFTGGYGLYLLFFDDSKLQSIIERVKAEYSNGVITEAAKDSYIRIANIKHHVNGSANNINNPIHPHYHMYHLSGMKQNIRGKEYNIISNIAKPAFNSKVFAKILDHHYQDNKGEYEIRFISGIQTTKLRLRIFEECRKMTVAKLDRVSKKIFNNITQNNSFINFVRAALVLYLAIRTANMIISEEENYASELIHMSLKIATLLVLIGPQSWNFFSNTILKLYSNGISSIITILNSGITNVNGDQPFVHFDLFFQRLFSNEVWGAKIPAVITSNSLGILWVLIILLAVVMLLFLMLEIFFIYAGAIITLSLLISLFPIVIISILFNPIKYIWESFFTLMLNYSLQAILGILCVSISVTFMAQHIDKILGIKVCKSEIFEFQIIPTIRLFGVKGWHLGEKNRFIPYGIYNQQQISNKRGESQSETPRFHLSREIQRMYIPPMYSKIERRYTSMPFLSLEHDKFTINELLTGRMPIDLTETLMLLLLIYLMFTIKDLFLEIAQLVSGASGFNINLGYVAKSAYMSSIGMVPALLKQTAGQSIGSVINRSKNMAFEKTIGRATRNSAVLKMMVPKALKTHSRIAVEKYTKGLRSARTADSMGSRIDFLGNGMKTVGNVGKKALFFWSAAPISPITSYMTGDMNKLEKFVDKGLVSSVKDSYKNHVSDVLFASDVLGKGDVDEYFQNRYNKQPKLDGISDNLVTGTGDAPQRANKPDIPGARNSHDLPELTNEDLDGLPKSEHDGPPSSGDHRATPGNDGPSTSDAHHRDAPDSDGPSTSDARRRSTPGNDTGFQRSDSDNIE